MQRNIWMALIVVTIGFGCGVSVDAFPASAAKAYCTQVYACCSAGETADAGAFGPDMASCTNNVGGQFDLKTGFLKSEQTKGRLTFHPDKAQACIDKLAALKCQELKSNATATPVECTTYVEPKTAVGGACAITDSCIGSWCNGGSATADGVCTSFLTAGQNCDAGTCAAGTFCDGSPRTCIAKRADGAACSTNAECATGGCNDKNPDGGVGTCGLKGGAGTTCFVTQGCSAAGPGAFLLLGLAFLLRRRTA